MKQNERKVLFRKDFKKSTAESPLLTPEKRKAFLDALSETAQIKLAARIAGTAPEVIKELRKQDKVFSELFKQAMSRGVALLEAEVKRRLKMEPDGPENDTISPIISQYPDYLLTRLFCAHKPKTVAGRRLTKFEEADKKQS